MHPSNWVNPEPAGRYNIVVIGAGTAGLITAVIAASLGAKVALIEKHLMGGDCLNVGCVPSKGIIRAARAWADLRNAEEFGLHIPPGVKYDFGAVMARMRKLRARISHNDSVHRYTKLGVDVYIGSGRFTGADTIQVEGPSGNRTLTFAKAAVCTGARASVPPTPGLKETGYLTNETVFSLTELPPRIGVIGAGPIGCELAQSFARFGSQVYLIEAMHGIMPNEDRDAAEIVEQQMLRDGVKLLCCGKDLKVQQDGSRQAAHRQFTRPAVRCDGRRDSCRRRPYSECRGNWVGSGRCRVRQERDQGERAAADDESQDFCGGRHLLALQVYPCRRCHGADRHSERPVPTSLRHGLCQRRILDHALVHLHGTGSRACRDV